MSNATINVNLEEIVFREANNEFSVGAIDNLKKGLENHGDDCEAIPSARCC